MVKKGRKEKKIAKIIEEKDRLAQREKMLSELKKLSIDKNTQSKLKSVVTSSQKHTRPLNTSKPSNKQ